jgi:hypothetical protein
MGVNGKQKGNSFERGIANQLSARFEEITGVEKGFRRNPDSGSFFGGTNVHRVETYDTDYAIYGDLICPRKFLFSIECKHYKTAPPLNAILKQKVGQWDKWLEQARQDAKTSDKKMMMIVKYNNTETMCFVDYHLHGLSYPLVKYGPFYVHTLKDVLSLEDDIFFNKD